MGEIRKDNLHESLIQELNELGNIDLSGKQDKNDNGLNTDSKVIVGAINELKNKFDVLYIQYEEVKNQVNESLKVVECVSLTINESTLEINGLNESIELVATVLPTNCNEDVIWVSTDPSIASVTNGVVTTIDTGKCSIIAVCGSKSASCQLTITDIRGTLVSEGSAIEDELFGCISTNPSYMSFNGAEKRIETRELSEYQVLQLPFSKPITNLSGVKTLNVTAYTKTAVSPQPEIIVGIKSAYKEDYTATNPFLTTNTVKMGEFISLDGGVVATTYKIDMTQFHGTSGYLVLGFRLYTTGSKVKVCISNITYS
jgi:hypothetical protein